MAAIRGALTARRVKAFVLIVSFQAFFLTVLSKSEARDLADVLQQGLTLNFPNYRLDTGDFAQRITPGFAGAIAQAVTQQFPLASVAPAFTYRYNPALSVFERTTGVPGPLFSERAITLGRGQFNFGVGYSFIDFDDLNGRNLDNLTESALFFDPSPKEAALAPISLQRRSQDFIAPVILSQIRSRIALQAHVIVPAFRYGITEKWDVSLAIPIVNTYLRFREESVPAVVAAPSEHAGVLYARNPDGTLRLEQVDGGDGVPEKAVISLVSNKQRPQISTLTYVKTSNRIRVLSNARGSATGVGDISLRSKYQFWTTENGGAAVGLALHLPSGEKRDFHGTGNTHLSTFLYLSHVIRERFEPHLNLGMDFNAGDVDRNSFLYAVGVSAQIWNRLGLVIDFIGRSEFAGALSLKDQSGRDLFPTNPRGLVLDRAFNTCASDNPCRVRSANESVLVFPERIKRNDLVDFSFGVRYALGTSGSVFFGGIIPLNDDGFRSDFIPSGGIEYTF